jgi:hypothetical protein
VVSSTPRPWSSSTPYTHCTGCWMGPRDDLDVLEKIKNLLPYQESNESRVYQPVP